MWDAIREGLGSVLAFFYDIIPNSGVAIILLTVSVRLLLFPLTAKQARSMIAMQRVQPEIKKLQAKYKNDRQKLNEEMMKFYKENEINPLGGCLPLVLQMPIFFALFQVLENIQKFIPTDSKMFHDICGGAQTPSACKPKMSFAGMDLTKSASTVASSGFAEVWPYLILVGIVVVTGFVTQRQTMRNQTQPNPQMAIIGKVFPLVFAFISWAEPSGLALYFAVSNIWQIGQQEMVYRTIVSKDVPLKKSVAEVEGSNPKDESRNGKGGGSAGTPKSDADGSKSSTGRANAKRPSGGGAKRGSGSSGATKRTSGSGGTKRTGGASGQGKAGAPRSNRKRKR